MLSVPFTKKNNEPPKKRKKGKYLLQCEFIIQKFVQRDKIVWKRDLAVLHKLFKTFPEFEFWYSIPVFFQMNAMHGFLTKKAQDFLKLEYAKFNLQIPTPVIIIPQAGPTCEKLLINPKRPSSIIDFCK